ncbi:RHS repeat-associated core domain-containing protein [Chryseobacterium sp. GP-SGM7]|uniref:RHS repeat-associated core domain-containing protein n=1 Tax=Chryseobacterium sp. GP-SGM7 TaxID=3411323 RepID=UPI003B926507
MGFIYIIDCSLVCFKKRRVVVSLPKNTTTSDNLRRYGYVYDGLNRLKAGFYQRDDNPTAKEYFEKIDYDLNGNITNLKRSASKDGNAFATAIDNLDYVYENNNQSNRLSTVTDTSQNYKGYPDTSGNAITYDLNGNMKSHKDKNILEIRYNYLNLPNYIKSDQFVATGGRQAEIYLSTTNTYRADGIKLKKIYTYKDWIVTNFIAKTETDYLDGFQYEKSITFSYSGNPELKFVPTSEGYFNFENNKYIYNYTDHLGNVRLSYFHNGSSVEVLEENNYYPFGLKHEGYNPTAGNPSYKYKYNGKELQETGMYDYGARFYMPDIGRWGVVDPLAEKYPSWSPYNYTLDNPIRYIDPDGRGVNDFVQRKDGSIYWDKNANSQATTKAGSGDTWLGKQLTFKFNSYIDAKRWDGPNSKAPGDKLTSTITLTARENSAGELTSLVGKASHEVGSTPIGTARDYYPGKGGSNNVFDLTNTSTGMNVNYEQHASVSWQEEAGMNLMGFKIVDVAQKLDINYNNSNGNLSVEASTNIFPSANLTVSGSGNTSTLMQYNQPSFPGTHTAPNSKTERNYGRGGISAPRKDFSYYPSRFYKRN